MFIVGPWKTPSSLSAMPKTIVQHRFKFRGILDNPLELVEDRFTNDIFGGEKPVVPSKRLIISDSDTGTR